MEANKINGSKKYIIYLVIILIVCAAAFYWWYVKTEEKKKAAEMAAAVYNPPVVTAITVKRADMPVILEYTGQTNGAKHAELRAQVSGIIQKKLYKEGLPVKAGQVMFVIDPSPYRAVMQQNDAALKQSEVNMKQMKIDFDRTAALYAKNAASKAQYDTSQSNYNASVSAVEASKAALQQARINLAWTSVRAPISGFASKEQCSVGNLVEAGGLLTDIVESRSLYVDFAIPADTYRRNTAFQQKGWLKTSPSGLYVELALGDGTKIDKKGKIDFQNQFITPQTAAINARAIFDNSDNSLYAGQFVRVFIKGYYVPKVIMIPLKSVVQAGDKASVFKLGQNGLPEKSDITILKTIGNNCLIGSGLTEGDRIIGDGVGKVLPGKEVKVQEAN